jgi:hypothetical protein
MFLPLDAKKKGRSWPGEKKGRRHPEALAEEARCGGRCSERGGEQQVRRKPPRAVPCLIPVRRLLVPSVAALSCANRRRTALCQPSRRRPPQPPQPAPPACPAPYAASLASPVLPPKTPAPPAEEEEQRRRIDQRGRERSCEGIGHGRKS